MKLGARKNSGFTLIEVMISMGLVAILSLVVFSLNNFMNGGQKKTQANYAADAFRKEIINLLNNPTSWRLTLRHATNPTFTCLRTTPPTDCGAAVNNGPPILANGVTDFSYSTLANTAANGACSGLTCQGGFNVIGLDGNPYYQFSTLPTAGFTTSGTRCSAGSPTGSPGWVGVTDSAGRATPATPTNASFCPFRLVLYWQPICPNTGSCTAPAIHVKGYTLYTPSPKDPQALGAFSPSQYGIDLVLPPRFQ
jgi:prepilin-type N-terminal cleavage/methylation domain-containing protein